MLGEALRWRSATYLRPLAFGALNAFRGYYGLSGVEGVPTGTRPGLTGYSPRTMCTSVSQIVVVVIRMTASPARVMAWGHFSTAMRS